MLDLVLTGMFTAFFLAAVGPLVDILSIFINKLFLNMVLSLSLSITANLLLGYQTINHLIVWTVAGAYLGSALLLVAERLASYRPALVNPYQ